MDGRGSVAGKRLFAFYVDQRSEEIEVLNPAFLWDLVDGESVEEDGVDLEIFKGKTIHRLLPALERYKAELSEERERQSRIKERYGVKSLEHLIVKLDGDLIGLYDRRDRGENVDLAIRNKEERKKWYEIALAKLVQTIQAERILTMSTPAFTTAIRIIPAVGADPAMRRDDEIERIGMEVAMRYEREYGRVPEDVSTDNLGFDLRSTGNDGVKRYIEVKARAGVGAVALTQNEWWKALRFGDDYFLYVVMNAANDPELIIVRNPAENLKPEEMVEMVRYIVPVAEINDKGEKV